MRIAVIIVFAALLASCATQSAAPVKSDIDPETKSQVAAALNVELGAKYIAIGDYQVADRKLRKAMEQDPKSSAAHWTYALLQARIGQITAADQYFKSALAINPNDSRGQNNYGAFLCENKRYEQADIHFKKALADPLYQFRAACNLNAGVCAMEMPNYDLAKEYFSEVLRLQPQNRVTLYQMAKLHLLQMDYAGAQSYIRDFEEVSEHTAESLWIAYQAERELGNIRSARSYAKLLSQSFPDSNEAAQLAQVY